MAKLLGQWVRWAGTTGFVFYFHETLVRESPDCVFEAIIAHELAHAFQMAHENVSFLHLAANPELRVAHERIAERLTEQWGFNQKAAKLWCRANIG